MATLRDSLIPVVNSIRGLPQALGVRTTAVTRRVRTWSGGEVQLGSYADEDIVLTPYPKVREVISGEQFDVGPVTPSMLGVGYSYDDLRPTLDTDQEVFWLVDNENGPWRCDLVDIDSSQPFRYQLRLRLLERDKPI